MYLVQEVGSTLQGRCEEAFRFCFSGHCAESSMLQCRGYPGSFSFNKETLRFQLYYTGGFLDGDALNHDTPYIEIGRCSPL